MGGFDAEGRRAVARTYAGLGAGFAALGTVCALWGGPLGTVFAAIAGLSALLALTAAAGFRQLAPGGSTVHADMAQFGWGLLNIVWTLLSVLMPVAVCVWLFVMDEEFWGGTLRTGVALPVFLVFSALVRQAHRQAARTFDESAR
ncbi:hypothetical protein FM076_29740 [Streptomyces albus subsp. chlorinus]|uniref:hypothetical protein n=1 Tax=Streptomyces albus TaxID=1888 RepID=UPI00156E3F17|nr:hypothetical protein [Streptomyces albus]NSC25119.1 hypothetical protein [Streptomyces albus subsp. chlorinus]